MSLDNVNQATGDGAHTFTIDVGHQLGVNGPGISTVQAWASYDDGQTWQPVQVVAMGNGKQRVVLAGPPTASTSGALTLSFKG